MHHESDVILIFNRLKAFLLRVVSLLRRLSRNRVTSYAYFLVLVSLIQLTRYVVFVLFLKQATILRFPSRSRDMTFEESILFDNATNEKHLKHLFSDLAFEFY